MPADPIRVIALCSLILGVFFLAKSISIKTPKYVLHELLAFKVNASSFFRKHISQKLEAVIGFIFSFVGFALLIYLEVNGLQEQERLTGATRTNFTNWWGVITGTVAIMLTIAWVLSRITRFFSGRIFAEHMRFMVEHHEYPLEKDHGIVRELGRILKIPDEEHDTLESYCAKVRAKLNIAEKRTSDGYF